MWETLLQKEICGGREDERAAWRADRYLLQHAKRGVGGGVALTLRRTTCSVALALAVALAVMLLELCASFRQILQLLRSASNRNASVLLGGRTRIRSVPVYKM